MRGTAREPRQRQRIDYNPALPSTVKRQAGRFRRNSHGHSVRMLATSVNKRDKPGGIQTQKVRDWKGSNLRFSGAEEHADVIGSHSSSSKGVILSPISVEYLDTRSLRRWSLDRDLSESRTRRYRE